MESIKFKELKKYKILGITIFKIISYSVKDTDDGFFPGKTEEKNKTE